MAMTPTPAPPRPQPSLATGTSGGAIGGLAVAGLLAGASAALSLPALCPFRICTGQACPGCGLSRSLVSLVRGDVATSWQFHPLIIPILIQALALVLLRGRTKSTWLLNAAIVLNGVMIFGVWVTRWRLGLLDFVIG